MPAWASARGIAARSHLLPGLVLLAATLLPLYAAARASRLLGDDAFITLTVARSLAQGKGLTYHGQPVLCTSTPLLALLVGGVARVLPRADLAGVAIWLGSAAWLATGWLVFAFRRTLGLGLWAGLCVALTVLVTGWTSALGMEVHLFELLLVLAVLLALARRPLAAGLAAGLCTLARGEGALVLPILAAVVFLPGRRTRAPAGVVVGWAAAVVPWELYAYRTYGSLLPSTLAAKTAQAASGYWPLLASQLADRWLPLWAAPWAPPWGPAHFWPANPVWWLVGLGLLAALLGHRRLLPFVGWAAAYLVAYALLGVPSYPWYVLPVFFVLQILAALGAARLADTSRWPAVGLALSVVAVAYLTGVAAVGRVNDVRQSAGDPRGPAYLGLTSWLRQNVPPSSSVAFLEVGYLGYFTDNPVVDLAAVVTPDLVDDVRHGSFAAGFYREQPDTFIYLPDFDWALGGIVSDPRFAGLYCSAATLAGPYRQPFTVYRKCAARAARPSVRHVGPGPS